MERKECFSVSSNNNKLSLILLIKLDIAKLLNAKIYAPKKKYNILLCLEDEELKSMLTENPVEAQVHVVSLRDIRADVSKYDLSALLIYYDRLWPIIFGIKKNILIH